MPKKKSAPQKPKVPEPEPEPEEEEVTCPVCGKAVGLEVTECPHCGAAFEEEEIEEIVEQPVAASKPASKAVVEEPPVSKPVSEDEMAACPVCGKMVSLAASTCPNCGAEFEAEEVEEVIEPVAAPPRREPKAVVEEPLEAEAVSDDEMAECPVCGKMVSLNVSACPNCGAEFEEEEVEEVIEVEEKASRASARPEPVEIEEVPMVVEGDETGIAELEEPTSIMDFRVIGVALIVLGIIGSQISFMIDWYWTWVPPIKSNLAMFIAIPAIVIVVGLLVYLLIRRAKESGRKVPEQTTGMSLSLFLVGILALVMVLLWNPINRALQHSSAVVGAVFVVLIVAGIALYLVKIRTGTRATA